MSLVCVSVVTLTLWTGVDSAMPGCDARSASSSSSGSPIHRSMLLAGGGYPPLQERHQRDFTRQARRTAGSARKSAIRDPAGAEIDVHDPRAMSLGNWMVATV